MSIENLIATSNDSPQDLIAQSPTERGNMSKQGPLFPVIEHVAIAGHIGVGKSTLTQLLSEAFDIQAFHEPNLENPFLKRFYSDMSQWAFHSQVFFLVHKFNAHRAHLDQGEAIIQDRTIYEDAEIFATHLAESGLMSPEEFKTYFDLYNEFIQLLPPPTLMIYLRASVTTLVDRIEKRGRPEEQQIPRVYLESLHQLYESWFERYDRSPKLVIEVDHLDYVNNESDRESVIQLIRERLKELT